MVRLKQLPDYHILPPELYEKKKGSMGKGIPGVELKVINEKGEKVKPGETGEVIAREII